MVAINNNQLGAQEDGTHISMPIAEWEVMVAERDALAAAHEELREALENIVQMKNVMAKSNRQSRNYDFDSAADIAKAALRGEGQDGR